MRQQLNGLPRWLALPMCAVLAAQARHRQQLFQAHNRQHHHDNCSCIAAHLCHRVLQLREALGQREEVGEHLVAVVAPRRPKVDQHLSVVEQGAGMARMQGMRAMQGQVNLSGALASAPAAGADRRRSSPAHRVAAPPLQKLLQLLVRPQPGDVGQDLGYVRLDGRLQRWTRGCMVEGRRTGQHEQAAAGGGSGSRRQRRACTALSGGDSKRLGGRS